MLNTKQLIIYLFSSVGFASLSVFGIINYTQGNTVAGIIELVAALIALANVAMVHFLHKIELGTSVILFIMLCVLSFITVNGGVGGTGVLWFATFPPLALYLKPMRVGFVWIALLALSVVGIYASGNAFYSAPELIQLGASFIAVMLLVYFYAIANSESQKLLVTQNAKMIALNDELSKKLSQQEQYDQNMSDTNQQLEDTKRATLNLLEDLQKEKGQDEAILASILDGLVVTDDRGVITLINDACSRILGWTAEELVGKKLAATIPMLNEQGEAIPEDERAITRVLTQKEQAVKVPVRRYQRKDGSTFPVAISIAPIIVDGELVGAVEVFRDITKELEIDKAKTEFVSIASHQLRTPMTSIRWVVERFVKKETLTEKGKEYMHEIQIALTNLSELVDALLNVSRIESVGGLSVLPKRFDLVEYLKAYIQEASLTAEEREVTLSFEHPDAMPVEHDKEMFRNIVQSLVSNAIEYTPKGGSVSVTLREEAQDNFLLSITDTGIGIPEESQPTIFSKFSRGANARSIKPNGTGLGLYIAHEAVKLLGGDISFTSKENEGTTFSVVLPKVVAPREGDKRLT